MLHLGWKERWRRCFAIVLPSIHIKVCNPSQDVEIVSGDTGRLYILVVQEEEEVRRRGRGGGRGAKATLSVPQWCLTGEPEEGGWIYAGRLNLNQQQVDSGRLTREQTSQCAPNWSADILSWWLPLIWIGAQLHWLGNRTMYRICRYTFHQI